MRLPVLLVFMLVVPVAFAHMEFQTPEYVTNLIMLRQGVSDVEQLDCLAVSDADLELLGDAVMERMSGDHELHEQMDAMMGGEGSVSLRSMHVSLGRNWLGCRQAMLDAGMMNANMMPMMMRMMGSYYPAYYSGYDIVLLFAVTGWVLFLAASVYFRSPKRKRR